MERAWPRTRDDIGQCGRDLAEMVERYVRADGSSDEGIQYCSHSFRAALPALAALARRQRAPMPPELLARIATTWNYVGALSSTAGEPGSCLRRGRPPAIDWMPDGAFTLIFGPDAVPDAIPPLPPLILLPDAGMASSCSPWNGGIVRIFLVGATADTGHAHRDKGSFLLEADGEVFAADRGMAPYQNSANVPFLKSEEAHNLAVPEGARQSNPSPFSSIWAAEGDGRRLLASVDTGKTRMDPVVACRRIVDSPRPDLIEIFDEIDVAEPRPIRFHLQTPLPLETAGSAGAVLHGRLSDMTVEAPWAVERLAGPCGVDWTYRPMNRLMLVSPPAREHRLRTTLRLVRR